MCFYSGELMTLDEHSLFTPLVLSADPFSTDCMKDMYSVSFEVECRATPPPILTSGFTNDPAEGNQERKFICSAVFFMLKVTEFLQGSGLFADPIW